MESQIIQRDLTPIIIQSYFDVYNSLGYGFLEKIYESAMMIQLAKHNLECYAQFPIDVHYDNVVSGRYYPDIIVNNSVIVELKSAETLSSVNEAQLLNYLRATDIDVGLLLNFGKTTQFKRKFFSNENKLKRA